MSIVVQCTKAITLHGDDDCLPDTMDCDVGDVYTLQPYVEDIYIIDYGTAFYEVPSDTLTEYFMIISATN